MSYLIDFFESLNTDLTNIESNKFNLEFSVKNEQLTITKGERAYLFYFTNRTDMFKNNLCREIIMIDENNAHLKLGFDNPLAQYLDLKLKNKSITFFMKSEEIQCPQSFIFEFEEKIAKYSHFSYLYLTLKMQNKYKKIHKQTKKVKI